MVKERTGNSNARKGSSGMKQTHPRSKPETNQIGVNGSIKKPAVQLCCVPGRVTWVNEKLKKMPNDTRAGFISKICFNGLLMIRSKGIHVKPMLALLSKWDRVNECFHLPDGKQLKITDEDVARVYGMPRGFGKLPLDIGNTKMDVKFASEFTWTYKLSGKRLLTVKDGQMQKSLVDEEDAIQNNDEDYWRLYVLNALYSVLIPTSDQFINLKFLVYLTSPQHA